MIITTGARRHQVDGLQLAAAIRTHCPELIQSLGVTFGDLKL